MRNMCGCTGGKTKRLQDDGLSMAMMAQSITHPVEYMFSHTDSISRVGGVDLLPTGSGGIIFNGGFKRIILFRSIPEISSASSHEKHI